MRFLLTLFFVAGVYLNSYGTYDTCANYFRLVQNAETDIIGGDYHHALILYEKAFAESGFAIDYLNAGFSALFVGNFIKSQEYFDAYLKRGGSPALIGDSVLKRFFPGVSLDYLKNLAAIKDTALKNRGLPIYSVQRKMVDSLFNINQKYLSIKRSLPKDSVKLHDSSAFYDYKVYKYLIQYIKTKGFPSEDIVGVDSDDATGPYHAYLYHNLAMKHYIDKEDIQFFIGAVCANKLSPYFLSTLISYAMSYDPYGQDGIAVVRINDSLIKSDSDIYRPFLKTGIVVNKDYTSIRFDAIRSTCYLDPYDNFIRKQIYRIKNYHKRITPFRLNCSDYTLFEINSKKDLDLVIKQGYRPLEN